MLSQAWLAGNPDHMLKKVIDMSIESGVVCAHTCMVGFETTPDRLQTLMKQVGAVLVSYLFCEIS